MKIAAVSSTLLAVMSIQWTSVAAQEVAEGGRYHMALSTIQTQVWTPELHLSDEGFAPRAISGCDASFTYTVGQPIPAAKTCVVTTTASVTFTVTTSASWIIVSPSNGTFSTNPTNLSISVNPVGKTGGTYTGSFTISGPQLAASTSSVSLTVVGGNSLTITTQPVLPSGIQSTFYSASLNATGGSPPYRWSLSSGNLPSGITLGSSGQIQGTPNSAGAFSFCAIVTDNATATASKCFTLTIAATQTPTLTIAPIVTVFGTVGQQLAGVGSLTAFGGVPPYHWVGSNLPPGITVSDAGAVAGTPMTTGDFVSTVTVTDSAQNHQSASMEFVINESASIGPSGCDVTFTYTIGQSSPSSQTCQVTTPVEANFTVAISDSWIQVTPTGGTLGPSPTNFVISVNPTNKVGGIYKGTFTISGPALNSITVNITLTVTAPSAVVITAPATLPFAAQSLQYSQPLSVSGGTPPYVWSVAPGSSLPPGLTIQSGVLVGTPTVSGTYSFAIVVTDRSGSSASVQFSVFVPGSSATGAFPHIAAGGSFITGVVVTNSSSQPAGFIMRFYNDAGDSVAVPFGQSGALSILSDVIPANGMAYYELGTETGPLVAGWGQITADGPINVQGFFRRHGSDGSYYEAAVPAVPMVKRFRLPFDSTVFTANNSQIYTGFAIANVDTTNMANISCTARDSSGRALPDAISVPGINPRGHWANYLFPALTGLRGTLDCTSSTVVAPIGLRVLGTNGISSISVTVE